MNYMQSTVAAAALLALSSCASMFARSAPFIHLSSTPTGLPFSTDYGASGVTPATLTPPPSVKRIAVTMAGQSFERRKNISGWVVANALWGIPGILGIIIDATNPNAYVWPDGSQWHVALPAVEVGP